MQYTDQLNNTIQLEAPPKKIISLVPSQTELLHYLGLNDEVTGITKFCVHPPGWFKNKTRIGGTKTIDIEKIKSLQPDLIIANKEENVQEQVEALKEFANVWVSDVNTLQDALAMIISIGEMVGKSTEAETLAEQIKNGFTVKNKTATAAYLIWKDPFMTVGGDTFISDMMQHCGLENAFAGKSRYPIVSLEDINNTGCQYILLSSEPYPFKQKHIDAIEKQAGNAKVLLVDGEMFSWYGNRLLYAATYFKSLAATL